MTNHDFDKFVEAQQAPEGDAAFVKNQLQAWRDYIEELYTKIEDYMHRYVEAGRAKIEYHAIQLNEEFSGPYEVSEMILHIGRSVIRFKPIGTMLIGTKGRVDVQGPQGTARLALVNKKASSARDLIRVTTTILMPGQPISAPPKLEEAPEPEWAWKISTPPPEMRFIDLTEEDFFQMVLAITSV